MRFQPMIMGSLAFLCTLSLLACAPGSDGTDAGTDGGDQPRTCWTNADCEEPETCQIACGQTSGVCEYQIGPRPDDNKLVGSFDCDMNRSYGSSEVIGKFQGRYVYMEYPGCLASFDPAEDPKAILIVDGVVTNELVFRLVFKVPDDSPTETAIKFGVGGVALGVFKYAALNADGYIVDETPVAEVIGGQIVFGSFGNATGNAVDGTFNVELKAIQ